MDYDSDDNEAALDVEAPTPAAPVPKNPRQRMALGAVAMVAAAAAVAAATPKNASLTKGYAPFSAALGGAYFVAWSASFYPQVFQNYRRRTTVGLSPDFVALNVLGFACYTAYTVAFYGSPEVRRQYTRRHHGSEPPASASDVLFSAHALLLSTVTLAQVLYYDGLLRERRRQRLSAPAFFAIIGIAVAVGGYVVAAYRNDDPALDFPYFLSYVKMAITFVKYLPQLFENYRRRSTTGWSIHNILLDFTGGFLSTLQLVLDCGDMRDWSGITGDLAKFALGTISVVFDLLFMVQHYALYPRRGKATAEAALLGDPADTGAAIQ